MSGGKELRGQELERWRESPAAILTFLTSALKKESVCSSEAMTFLYTHQVTEIKPNKMPIFIKEANPKLTFWLRTFLQILAQPVIKMWVIQKPNKVALWNKRHFEEKKMEIIQHV